MIIQIDTSEGSVGVSHIQGYFVHEPSGILTVVDTFKESTIYDLADTMYVGFTVLTNDGKKLVEIK